jgi:hypothetical protein
MTRYIQRMVTAVSPSPARHIKPYCRALTRGSLGADLDGRSVSGKFVRRIEAELVEQLGGSPTFSQTLAIRRIARLSLQAESFDTKLATDWTPHDARTAAGINNAILRALKDLDLKAKAIRADPVASLNAIAAEIGGA